MWYIMSIAIEGNVFKVSHIAQCDRTFSIETCLSQHKCAATY